jgi:flagellar FliJ protein
MKPFSMEPVLRYRQQLADEARQKLFSSQKVEAEIQTRLIQATDRLKTLYADLSLERTRGTTIDRLLLFENRIPIVQKEIKEVQVELEKQQKVVERRRRHVIQANQDKKALEKLKERQDMNYKKYVDKKEAAMLDEIAILRHGRLGRVSK